MEKAIAVVERMREELEEKRIQELELKKQMLVWRERNGVDGFSDHMPPMSAEYFRVKSEAEEIVDAITLLEFDLCGLVMHDQSIIKEAI